MPEHVSEPLVSIVCITYNSARYVVEALDSFARQTYPNIELIISDDCSTDGTVAVCREWVEKYGSRFRRVKIVTAERNTGTAGNLNRGIRAACGEWVKTMAGDDRLVPHSIARFAEYAGAIPACDIASCRLLLFDSSRCLYDIKDDFYDRLQQPLSLNLEGQYRELLKRYYIPGPGWFFRKSLWNKVGGYDERYPFLEEDTFMLDVMEHGVRVFPITEKLVEYRYHSDSLSHGKDGAIGRHDIDRMRFYYDNVRKKLIRHRMYAYVIDYDLLYGQQRAIVAGKWHRARLLGYGRLVSPVRLWRMIRRIFGML